MNEQLLLLIEDNDGDGIRELLADYKEQLGELEQGLACSAVKVFRKGKDPDALIALLDAGFDFLGRNSQGQSPIEDMVEFWNWARSRKEEARKTIKIVMDRQYNARIAEVERTDRSHAVFITRVQKRTKRKPRQRKSTGLGAIRAFIFSALALLAAQFGIYA